MCSGCAESYLLPNKKIQERVEKTQRERERERNIDPEEERRKSRELSFDELFGELL
jgi:hypothetical protein